MIMTTYFEKLKDPRWQKKRLEVLASKDFRCEVCHDASKTLHVHHKQYFKRREPWEYEAKQLSVVCETCHKEGHHHEDPLLLACSYVPVDGPMAREYVASLVAGFCNQGLDSGHADADPVLYAFGKLTSAISCWSQHMLSDDERKRICELSELDPIGLASCLKAYLDSKTS